MLGEEIMINSSLIIVKGDPLTKFIIARICDSIVII
jgi:hypothetical protein